MNLKYLNVLVCLLVWAVVANGQIVINEGSNKNYTQVADEDNEYEDWIEIYNASDTSVNLGGWSLSDDSTLVDKWVFPSMDLGAHKTLIIFASGKDRRVYNVGSAWESPVIPADDFHYKVTTSAIEDWNTLSYNASNWKTGSAGFGYADGDDETLVPKGTLVVYIRKMFSIPNTSVISDAICHVDYDDGFVAYLNGVEICRGNVTGTPTWSSTAAGNHEAGSAEAFELDMDLIRSIWRQGDNVFAVEVHNVTNTSSDLSLIPYLSFKVTDGNSYFSAAPSWLTNVSNKNLHTNFKISSQGETIRLYNAQKSLVSLLAVPNLSLNHSVGCATDGSDSLALFSEATPGATNNSSLAYTHGYAGMPIFSVEPGFYEGNQSLKMFAQANAEIRYTTDGSMPTETSNLFDGTELSIEKTTTVKARCFSLGDQLPGKVKVATYFINEHFTIPVLSLSTNNENLFGSTGIFTNWRESWNKPCYIEYFDDHKELVISQASGIQVDGGAGGSRSKPQTSFRIEPGNGTFGDGDVQYNFHPERPNRTNYESLYLRNGSNRYLDLIYKDASQVRGMGKDTYNFYSEYRPIIVFINGGYYGLYEGREKINADYLKSNYGIDTDSLNMVGISHFKQPRTILPIVGTTDAFFDDYDRFLAMNPSDASYLEEVGKIIDLDNYTDYMAGQTWMTNKDWPHNNMKAWRCKGSDMRWQFALVDLEWAFLPTNTGANLATRPTFDQINYMNGVGTQWPASGYWFKLMQNEEYKDHFINRMCDLMNTSYDYTELNKIESAIYKEVVPEIPAYYERWNGGNSYAFFENHEAFNSELKIREAYVRQHLRKNYSLKNDVEITLDVKPAEAGRIKISTLIPEDYPWVGEYFSDVKIKIEALPNPGYAFSSWDNNSSISNIKSAVFNGEISDLNSLFTANFVASESTFNGITISEINYKSGDSLITTDWFEIWNASSEDLSLDGWYFTDNDTAHTFVFDPNLSIPAGERMIVAQDKDYFASLYPDVKYITGGYFFGLGSPNDEIMLYNSLDELVAYVTYSDLYPWPLKDDNSGRTLELLNPKASLLNFYNWFAGCYMGSPGTAYDPDCGGSHTALKEKLIANNLAIKAYPNPMKNRLSLEFYVSTNQSNTTVSIYNVMGALVYKERFAGLRSGLNTLSIDVSMLKEGQMYFVSVNSAGVQKTMKVIKE